MTDNVAGFLLKTAKMGSELTKLEHRTVEIASLAVKNSVLVQLQAAGVDKGKLRGVGKKGSKVGVRYDIAKNKGLVRATGPFHLIERDTRAHRIGQKKSGSGLPQVNAAGEAIRLTIPGVGFRAWANHPGTKGKHPWAKGVAAAIPIQNQAQALALIGAVKKAYT